jgi:predicted transporter
MQKLVAKLVTVPFIRKALADNADLSAFKGKPSLKVVLGVSSIAISYVIGWPLITFLGAVAVHYERPAIAVVGGPLAYALSHLVFLLGMYLAGALYSYIFLRWLTRVTMLKLFKLYPNAAPPVDEKMG